MRKDNSIDFLGTMKTTKSYLLIYLSFLLLTHLSREKVIANSWRGRSCRTGGEMNTDQVLGKKRRVLTRRNERRGKPKDASVDFARIGR